MTGQEGGLSNEREETRAARRARSECRRSAPLELRTRKSLGF
jgi:hypothetical protein